ncbi:cupin-like domain-containing protein [Tolypothrix bouteillei VB521301]|uniref:Cupin-like domain-containing protein n=3 Tax=Nostocales TaxID=1161 RepID=A0A8S9TEU2_9CYAN|nr:cupin-like domain-containing protein [Tolypothrix bouteillei VB521301]
MHLQSKQNFESEVYNITHPILRIDIADLTPKIFFEKYRKTSTPVIITGLLKDESDWTLDYLCEKLGNQKFVFRNYGSARYKQDKRNWKSIGSGVDLQIMSFSEFAELMRSGKARENDINLGKHPLKNTPLADNLSLTSIGEKLGLKKSVTHLNIYVNPAGHSSGLHYDSVDGTLMQMHGSKKVVLFPPSQTNNLYPFPFYIHLFYGMKMRCWFSKVNVENPDFTSFPKFKEALQHRHEAILNLGETLFIPEGWWHDVTALGDEMVCAVNRFWRVYPISRVLLSRSRWRAVLGMICALPHILFNFATVAFSRDRKQKFSKISHRL